MSALFAKGYSRRRKEDTFGRKKKTNPSDVVVFRSGESEASPAWTTRPSETRRCATKMSVKTSGHRPHFGHLRRSSSWCSRISGATSVPSN